MEVLAPYLLFLGDARDQLAAKTAAGLVHWRPDRCVGQLRLPGCKACLPVPDMTIEAAAAAGVRTLIVGVANAGGFIPETWIETLSRAIDAGMDIASGLHDRLANIPALKARAEAAGRRLLDVRHPDRSFPVATGIPRSGRRLLTVGTDCSVGKMYTALAIERELHARGHAADFRATGQTGILIAGGGVSIDAVIADFISGAVEWLSPPADAEHWDLIEGQGSLFHPSYAGVSLGLLHGAQAEALVMCHEPTRTHMRGLPHQPLPDLFECIHTNLFAAHLTEPNARCIGLSLNTASLGETEARETLARFADHFGLPCVDPVRTGVGPLVDVLV